MNDYENKFVKFSEYKKNQTEKKEYISKKRENHTTENKDNLENKKFKKGQKLTPKQYCVYLLSKREYSQKEIRDKLRKREHTEKEIQEALDWITEHNFQSDDNYARIKSKNRSSSSGNLKIKFELSQKGISENIIKEKIKDLPSEKERVYNILLRKKISLDIDRKLKEKIYRQLASKGFSYESISKGWDMIINELKEE